MDLNKLIVALDAGHGGHDGGAQGRLHPEKHYNKLVTDEVRRLLLLAGAWPLTLRWSNELRGVDERQYMRIRKRCELINRFRAVDGRRVQVVLSIHHNGVDNPRARGTEVWYYKGSIKGEALARGVLEAMVESMPFRNRGIQATRLFGMLRRPRAPAILTEGCFVTNPREEKWLAANGHIVEAAAIVQGLRNAELEL